MRRTTTVIVALAAGVLLGGWLFSRSIPRSFLAVSNCGDSCYKLNDLAGLFASVGIQTGSTALVAEAESTQCVAIKHPRPENRVHYVLFPKRDAKSVLELQPEDGPFVLGCFALAGQLARTEALGNYRLYSNGPALQHITYVHFHLVAK